MAKKAEKKESTGSAFDDIINEEFSEVKDLSKEDISVKGWIDSGNYAVNYICSKNLRGAYPMGRIVGFSGKSGVGKSMFPDIAIKDKKIDRVVMIDSEGGGNGKELLSFLEVPIEKVRYIRIQTLDSYKVSLDSKGKQVIEVLDSDKIPAKLKTAEYEVHVGLIDFLKKLVYALEYKGSTENVLIIVDSLANIKSTRNSIMGKEDMGKTNKLLNVLFGSLDNSLNKINATFLFAGKVYTDLNNAYNTEGIINGGESVIYNPSLLLSMTSLQDNPEIADGDAKKEKEIRKTSLGNSYKTIRVRVKKSRFGTEGRNAWVVLDATYGLVRNSGLFQLLVDFKVCVKNGSFYTIPGVFTDKDGKDKSFYKKDFLDILAEDEEHYIDLLQNKLEEAEKRIEYERKHRNVNDIDEAVAAEEDDDDEISMFELQKAMEVEQEISREETNTEE